MLRIEEIVSNLNDLVEINHDRIRGYEKAIEAVDSTDVDLIRVFSTMISNSREHIRDLSRHILTLGGEVAKGSTTSGKLFRTWMDVKSAFASDERTSTLQLCESGEDAAQTAYAEALKNEEGLTVETIELLRSQKASLRLDHDEIKALRDLHEDVS
ncbi:MAG: PA2169 family four-helix-bundle protein [Alphaproteobacteria bacterium]|nr:PA2169 family four-helix-bundle protein [Alphaproteobacteria bacterium]